MRKILTVLATASIIGVTALATSSTADARWGRGWGWGPGPFFGGLAAGAIIGGAIAAPYYYGGYGPYYPYGPYYRAYGPYGPYGCWRRAWNGALMRVC